MLASATNFSEQEGVFPNNSQQLQPWPRGSKLLLIMGSRETGYAKTDDCRRIEFHSLRNTHLEHFTNTKLDTRLEGEGRGLIT